MAITMVCSASQMFVIESNKRQSHQQIWPRKQAEQGNAQETEDFPPGGESVLASRASASLPTSAGGATQTEATEREEPVSLF